jgi:translation initiation factor IF-2
MSVVPAAGDRFTVTTDEAGARDVAESRQRLQRQALGSATGAAIIAQAAGFADGTFDNREIIKVPVLLKADVSGSVEAIRMAVEALQSSDKEAICKVDVMYAGVGDVTSSDVSMASAAKAKVIAFNVAAAMSAMDDARGNNVNIGYYNVVYDLLDELAATVERTLAPPPPGNLVGRAEIKKVFKLGKVGKIAGCMVTEGVLRFDSQIRVMRGKRNVVHLGKFSSLKIVKDVVQEVSTSTECGVSFEDFQDFEEEDVIECFTTSEE